MTLVEEAQREEGRGRRAEARALYERALRRLTPPGQAAVPDLPAASDVLRSIGHTYHADADPDAALDCFEAAVAAAEASGDEASAAHAFQQQAAAHFEQGRLDEAERAYLRARESAHRAGAVKLAAAAAQNLGVIASVHGDVPKAVRHYETSLAECRATGLARDACVCLNNLGRLYTDAGRWEKAEGAFDEAVEISTALGALDVRTLLEVNRAELWVARGDLERARESCNRAVELARLAGAANPGAAHALGGARKLFGVIAREAGEYEEAEEAFGLAERTAEERHDFLLAAETAREKADLHRRQGRNGDALQCLNRAHRLFSRLRARRDLADVNRRTSGLEAEFLDVVRRWSESIESKDRYTQGHCERVADLACALAARAGLDAQGLFWFRIGALLHDVGKLVIPSEVLNKPGELTLEEWTLVKRHPTAGVEMLADVDFPWAVRPIIESHHERWDGGGYPHGLAGEAIPLTARILCLADAYDALTSARSYRRALPRAAALEQMRRDAGRQFDPSLFALFEEVLRAWPHDRATAGALRGVAPAIPKRAPRGHVDDLTGLPLRRALVEAATEALAAGRETRRPVSLLVIDVDHFKLVNDTFGHLQGDDVLRAVADLLRRNAGAGGLVGRYAGDEFVAVLPDAGPEEAQAVAERLRAAVDGGRFELRASGGQTIAVTLSIGAASAPAHGDAFETLFAAADRALYEAKRGGRNAVAVSRAEAEPQRPQLHVEHFVGHGGEMRRLVSLLEASTRGEPRAAALVGEAGIGKSALLRRLAPEVRLRAGSLVQGRCLEADVKPPYGPWADVLDAIRALGVVPVRQWRELPRLVPELGDGMVPPDAAHAGSKYALLDEIAQYVRLAAASRPITIVLDDMQWADSATWDALEHLLAQLDHDRVLLCLTLRAEDTSADAAERRRRLSRDERFFEITLARLTRTELKQWVEGAFHGQAAGRELLAFLYEHTEGNPLIVVQALRTLAEDGAVWHTGEQWAWRPVSELRLPSAVGDLIARRLDRLSPAARAALTTAAVVGRVFDVDLVVAARGCSEDEILDAIDEGIDAAVLEPGGSRDGDRFAFAHGLLADAMRRSENPRRLKRMHERVARAMELQRPDAVGEIAAHHERGGDSARAHRYALMAGSRATGVYAHDEATAFFSMAERHAGTPRQLAEARLRLAEVAEAAGRYVEAERQCGLVLDALDGAPDRALALTARRTRERLRALLGQPHRQTIDACRTLLAEADAMGMRAERVALLTVISQAHSRLGEWAAAELLARECVTTADETGDARLRADALTRLGTTLLASRPHEAIALYEDALELFTAAEDRHGQVRCYINRGIGYSLAGNRAAAEEAYEIALDLGRSSHAPDLAGAASANLGVLCMKEGRYEQAQASFEEALRLFTAVKNESHRLGTLYNLGHLARERGDAVAALDLYRSAGELAHALGQPDVEIGALAGAGLAGLRLGELDAAESALRDAAALLTTKPDWWFQGRELVEALAVRVALAAEGAGAAGRRFSRALALAERHDEYGAAWLVAECATPLAAAGVGMVWEAVARYAPRASELGYTPLSRRYAALGGARTG